VRRPTTHTRRHSLAPRARANDSWHDRQSNFCVVAALEGSFGDLKCVVIVILSEMISNNQLPGARKNCVAWRRRPQACESSDAITIFFALLLLLVVVDVPRCHHWTLIVASKFCCVVLLHSRGAFVIDRVRILIAMITRRHQELLN
jgi:hypothetical protein